MDRLTSAWGLRHSLRTTAICLELTLFFALLRLVLPKNNARRIFGAGLGAYSAAILWITLLNRSPSAVRAYRLNAFAVYRAAWRLFIASNRNWQGGMPMIPQGIWELVLNVLLFLPFGALLAGTLRKPKTLKALLVGFAFSALIETLQLLTRRGTLDTCDLIENALGATLGTVVSLAVTWVGRKAKGKEAERIT